VYLSRFVTKPWAIPIAKYIAKVTIAKSEPVPKTVKENEPDEKAANVASNTILPEANASDTSTANCVNNTYLAWSSTWDRVIPACPHSTDSILNSVPNRGLL